MTLQSEEVMPKIHKFLINKQNRPVHVCEKLHRKKLFVLYIVTT